MFSIKSTLLSGCYEIHPPVFEDTRGRFVKVFHAPSYHDLQLETRFLEEYYSHSVKGVVRGMHFQNPPHDHVKIVYCVQGEVFDVVVDLRIGSPTYGKAHSVNLSAQKGNFLYIPKGLAHGFCVTSTSATLVYKVGSVHVPASDSGILWSSIDVDWPISSPTLSNRDASFPSLAQFKSPFTYG